MKLRADMQSVDKVASKANNDSGVLVVPVAKPKPHPQFNLCVVHFRLSQLMTLGWV